MEEKTGKRGFTILITILFILIAALVLYAVLKPEPVVNSAIVKSDKPTVELFVMSHCPYGVQMERGILPVISLLGDKIDFELKFVHYAMHGDEEIIEQMVQYCIQKNDPNNFPLYLACFLDKTNTKYCINQLNISTSMVEGCFAALEDTLHIRYNAKHNKSNWVGGKFPNFPLNAVESIEKGVKGSPTLIINNNIVNTQRSPQALLTLICSAFNTPPNDCQTTLSIETPKPGFGDFSNAGSGDCTI